jgi:glutamyl-tRNA synthetase
MKLRFAPSPTGALHVGSARVAILNFLFAKHYHANLVLRIEDTDLERSTNESVQDILQTLHWLGIYFQEGPYYQSQRTDLYQKYIQILLDKNQAYRCFCSSQDLEEMRNKQIERHEPPGYDGTCSHLAVDTVQKYLSEGKPFVVRLRVPNRMLEFQDLIKGTVSFDGSLIPDFVIARQDGSPTYQLAVVVDDYEMGITHVIRGEDHVSNTPKQIAIYQALDLPLPQFAHIPLIIGQDRSKLSKRHGDTSINAYREKGYLSDALVNYFALLGNSHDPNQEIQSLQEMIDQTSFENLSKSPSMFDLNKLTWMNHCYIQNLPQEAFLQIVEPFTNSIALPESTIQEIAALSQTQMKTLQSIQDICEPFVQYKIDWSEKNTQKLLKKSELIGFLEQFLKSIQNLEEYSISQLEEKFDNLLAKWEIKKRDAVQIIRFAVTGKLISPPLFDTLFLIGQRESIERMNQFLQEVVCQRQEIRTEKI